MTDGITPRFLRGGLVIIQLAMILTSVASSYLPVVIWNGPTSYCQDAGDADGNEIDTAGCRCFTILASLES